MLILPKVNEPAFEPRNKFPALYWNHVALQMNRVTHSLGGPHTGPTMSSRALGLLHLSMHDAFFGILDSTLLTADRRHEPYLAALRENVPGPGGTSITGLEKRKNEIGLGATDNMLAHANAALTGAAVTVLDRLYRTTGPGVSVIATDTLVRTLGGLISDYAKHIDVLGKPHRFGVSIAETVLDHIAVKPGEIGADAGRYEPRQERYFFRDEPSHPVRLDPINPNDPAGGTKPIRVYHGPFYGTTVRSCAVHNDAAHQIAPPPVGPHAITPQPAIYESALKEVVKLGGAAGLPSTNRTPDNTVAALYWAYDGANLIGTPPRLYNQIVREVAWRQLHQGSAAPNLTQADDHADLVRVFALCNAAMTDAGKFAWKEKFKYEFWRPLSGVREHDAESGPAATPPGADHLQLDADPFWLALGAPETNSNLISFKPPFPAYPSGHATFGAACFQMMRLFYKTPGALAQTPDELGFSFVSDELDGVSRDLYQRYDATRPLEDQPGLVRTRIVRKFGSLWRAIFENAFSRIWLGVHWNFDAFAATDGVGKYDTPEQITYTNVYSSNRTNDTAYPIGGVPLGLGIANDIFATGLTEPIATGTSAMLPLNIEAAVKASNTATTRAARLQ
ncbi:vanadium-dependent haloperoxidase [Methylobacterium sp. WL19]|uniref:vanadium-dependent haloperoxidase n=1 Tax=Methylobacterium sp. WL19 TaxID=2603896 RepID=UPI0011C966BD|nr:vanadium-dependent haloperoxidase [Methylobacterium sp. WL19]TXN33520.1 vanadium-dependent haloperoxidase [Methylobacterium sp. WL19]